MSAGPGAEGGQQQIGTGERQQQYVAAVNRPARVLLFMNTGRTVQLSSSSERRALKGMGVRLSRLVTAGVN